MQLSGPQQGAFEGIYISMWLRMNDLAQLTNAADHSIRGHLVFLDVKPLNDPPYTGIGQPTRDVPLGQSCSLGVASPTLSTDSNWMVMLVGAIESNFVLGKEIYYAPGAAQNDNYAKTWITVQTYGYHSGVCLLSGRVVATDDYLFVDAAIDFSVVQGFNQASIDSLNTVVSTTVVRSNKPAPSACFVGWRAGPVAELTDASSAALKTLIKTVPAFLLCMGQSPRG